MAQRVLLGSAHFAGDRVGVALKIGLDLAVFWVVMEVDSLVRLGQDWLVLERVLKFDTGFGSGLLVVFGKSVGRVGFALETLKLLLVFLAETRWRWTTAHGTGRVETHSGHGGPALKLNAQQRRGLGDTS